MTLLEGVLAATLILAPVLVLTGLGGVVHQRSGVVNIALEGFILVGAFAGILAADAFSSGLVGLVIGTVAGTAAGWLFSAIVTRLNANEIIVGLGLNTLLLGVIGLVLSEQFGSRSAFRPTSDIGLPSFGLGFLDEAPILGTLLARRDLVVWATIPAVLAVGWALNNTRWGLRVRAAGGGETATTSLGLSVPRVRDGAGAIAGALAGLGGAHLSIAAAGLFSPGISAGRGYIALAAVYFGRTRPVATTLAALVYVVVDAAQGRFQLQVPGIPVQLIQTLPYVAVIAALTLSMLARRDNAPN